jgi:hypothetical protein
MKKYVLLIMVVLPLFYGCPSDNEIPIWGEDYTTVIADIDGIEMQYEDISQFYYEVVVIKYRDIGGPVEYYRDQGNIYRNNSSGTIPSLFSIPNVQLPNNGNPYHIKVRLKSNDCSRGCVGSCPPPVPINNNYGKPEFYTDQGYTSATQQYTFIDMQYVACN